MASLAAVALVLIAADPAARSPTGPLGGPSLAGNRPALSGPADVVGQLVAATEVATSTAVTPTPDPSTAVATSSPTAVDSTTATALSSATATGAVTVTPSPAASPTADRSPGPSQLHIPYAARAAVNGPPRPRRRWGAQFGTDHYPDQLDAIAKIELPRAREVGIGLVRTHLYWSDIAPTERAFEELDWASTDARLRVFSEAGFDIVLSVVDYPGWAMRYRCGYGHMPGKESAWPEFVRSAVARYGRPPYRVVAWEIGNEVDGETMVEEGDHLRDEAWGKGQPTVPHGGCWGDRPAEYASFLAAAADAIREVDPDAAVTLGNLALIEHPDFHVDFLDRFLEAGGAEHIDYFGYHWFPDLRDVFPDWGLPTGIEKFRWAQRALAGAGRQMPIWLTETYRLTKHGMPESEGAQVGFVTRELVELIARTDLDHIVWYGWLDFAGQPEGANQRGIVRADHEPKPALAALPWIICATDGHPTDLSEGNLAAYAFRDQAGTSIVAWTRDGRRMPLHVATQSGAQLTGTELAAPSLEAHECCPVWRATAGPDGLTLRVGGDTQVVRIGARGARACPAD